MAQLFSLGHLRMKPKRVILALALIVGVSFSAWMFCRQYPVPPWAAYQAQQRISLVHAGMTDTQFWDTLGLSRYKFYKGVMGSGRPDDFPMSYRLWYREILYCRWNLTNRPPILKQAYFVGSYDELYH